VNELKISQAIFLVVTMPQHKGMLPLLHDDFSIFGADLKSAELLRYQVLSNIPLNRLDFLLGAATFLQLFQKTPKVARIA
jgi:hypothetical protein